MPDCFTAYAYRALNFRDESAERHCEAVKLFRDFTEFMDWLSSDDGDAEYLTALVENA